MYLDLIIPVPPRRTLRSSCTTPLGSPDVLTVTAVRVQQDYQVQQLGPNYKGACTALGKSLRIPRET